ncbi:MAG: HD domain-containing protein [Oscillospiraceae bacterium]|jgi:uncharacterized protein|nr:HD domain-containing protein [Oscillospiraceae bacterium]
MDEKIEQFMLSQMSDSAHDREHVYRVLYYALDIAAHEGGADYAVLTAACLLHDIGRSAQFANPALDHAEVGAEMARKWLTDNGYEEAFTERVCACIRTHRFRSNAPPQSIEAKILFDADKVDVCGAIGMARTISYGAHVERPLYTLSADGSVSDGTDCRDSVFGEYKFKLEGLYDGFFTEYGSQLAKRRQVNAVEAYNALLSEARDCYANGKRELERLK